VKGVFLQQQLEFRLNAEGDFRQGSAIKCEMSVKNHLAEDRVLKNLALCLALGDLKKVKRKEQDAFTIVSAAELPLEVHLKAEDTVNYSWTFTIDPNGVISDKSQSLYILFGNSANLDVLGQLPLTVTPHQDIVEVLAVFESAFNFVVKGKKSSKDWLCIKIQPAAAAKYSMLDQLTLSTHFDGELLKLKYVFDLKRFEATASSLGVSKKKSTVLQDFPAEQYKRDGFVDHGVIEEQINAALAEVI
jgi:hypothetical protein